MAQWKRAGPITQRSVDRNYALLDLIFYQIHRSDFSLQWNHTTAQQIFVHFWFLETYKRIKDPEKNILEYH